MWIDETTKVTLETVRFLGVPFSYWPIHPSPRYRSIYRYKRTADGVRLQMRRLLGTDRWRDLDRDIFKSSNGFFYRVRPGKEPIKRD